MRRLKSDTLTFRERIQFGLSGAAWLFIGIPLFVFALLGLITLLL
jgi:hypothetical protein